jgi:acyl dehydratase
MEAWTVTARNLPEHARNRIHTDEGGREAGYPGALVAGVTVHAYLSHVAAAHWGLDWVRSGTAEVAFRSPVLAGDVVVCEPTHLDGPIDDGNGLGGTLEVAALVDGETRATARFSLAAGDAAPAAQDTGDEAGPDAGEGERLRPLEVVLRDEWDGYGRRCGDDLALYDEAGVVHPAVWPALANGVVHQQLVTGSWVHTRSRVRHYGVAPIGAVAIVESTVVRRFTTRAGDRAVLDVRILVDGRLAAVLEHEAIVSLGG